MHGPAGHTALRVVPLLVAVALAGWCARACAQQPSPTAPALPGALPLDQTDELSPVKLLDRLRRMEQTVNELHARNSNLEQKYEHVLQELERTKRKVSEKEDGQRVSRRSYDDFAVPAEPGGPDADDPRRTGSRFIQNEGGFTREFDEQGVGNRQLGKLPANGRYNYGHEGIQFETEDQELFLKFRYLVQTDALAFTPASSQPVTSGFYLPRARLYFDGRLTRPVEWQVSFQQAYDSFNLLNAFLHLNYDPRLQLRVGRFKTPYTYEFYKINIWDLNTPERSLYNVNFALNRQLGAAASGELFNDRLEYAVGAFGGQRNSYQPFKNTPDVIALLNAMPFGRVENGSWLSVFKDLNIGGSAAFGNENNPLTPAVLRTSANASNATINSPSAYNSANVPFLAFNDNVRERGARALWEMHLAYFYRSLTLLGAWDSGFESWAHGSSGPRPVRVPVDGYFVQAAYLVTGETRTETGLIDPIRRFDLRPGRFGLGAFEPTARFSELTVGRQVFTGGLADPNLWSNKAYMVDLGLDWYLNKFVKIYFDWEHAIFGQPVYYAPDRFSKTSNTFWARFQVYY